jgi:surface polysaccharide O-acyltransferase-like enzyme
MVAPEKKYLLWYFVALWIIFEPIASIANQFFDFRTNFTPPMATGFIGFFILGYLLGEIKLSQKIFLLAIFVWLISTICTGISTYFLNINSEQFDYFFYYFLSLPGVFSSISGFIIFRQIATYSIIAKGWIFSLIKALSPASFGIYLIHIFVLEILDNRNPFVQINTNIGNPIWSIPVVSLLVFFVSFVIVFVMQKIPIVKKIVP